MMTEERRRILNMLAEGKLNAAEAENLLDALASPSGGSLKLKLLRGGALKSMDITPADRGAREAAE